MVVAFGLDDSDSIPISLLAHSPGRRPRRPPAESCAGADAAQQQPPCQEFPPPTPWGDDEHNDSSYEGE